MVFLPILAVVGSLLCLVFVILCLASGLYFFAEFIEENTVLSKKIIGYMIWVCVGSHILLFFTDGFPWTRVLFSLACQGWYSAMLPTFPAIQVTSIRFIVSCVLAVADHFSWFFYFAHRRNTVAEVGSFFAILVWMVPFLFFISLSANDHTLPAFDSRPLSSPTPLDGMATKKNRSSFIKYIVRLISKVKDDLIPSTSVKLQ
ncbi:hypothetical protein BASA50_008994 [Batrachochytrium salamandrivorans]|uniref:Protein SVP26 n=1 Tax=Batrachochytrium salamandrivorans TaxID=1357716 RepID=A0ABQ8F2I4_9FUNG|nr:hypothetical protein BASA62_000058 [Batrachochytrium salamandrivorans]KAH6573062.1 hypothetical protein BASA60_006230 [Batrachochytrium salamandrivorans]KAH6578426.1 hypothetical protein BASA61_000183 [Batrachochytrium salamandrivorans]KAH6590994.1 hypothetical protein BASA50_008994 [Batrachochytrium salamandrivorans]KAH9268594.1 hypothetical protein BASA84_000201 [Batrachochytrium salamandrivorans]